MVSEKQKIFDEKKWQDSIEQGKDMCGSYDYCCACVKEQKNPCEMADKRYKKMNKKVRAQAKAKFNTVNGEVFFRSTVLDK